MIIMCVKWLCGYVCDDVLVAQWLSCNCVNLGSRCGTVSSEG
jgi:hypothetical protein